MNKYRTGPLQRAGLPWAVVVALIVWGCDAEWGGIDVGVRQPQAPRPETPAAAADTVERPQPIVLPSGPVLFHVTRLDAGGRALIEPVAEVVGGGLRTLGPRRPDRGAEYASEFASHYYPRDRSYALQRHGARVGAFVVRSAIGGGSEVCPPLRAEGQLELRPPAANAREFLAAEPGAWPMPDTMAVPAFRADMRSLAPVLAERLLAEHDVEGSWRIRAPADLRPVDVGEGRLGFAATFVVRDSLAPGPPGPDAGMIFVVADYAPARGYFPLFWDANAYGPGQKRVVRWIDALDAIPDPGREWVLRAHGDAMSWYEVVALRDTARSVVWTSRNPVCEAAATDAS